MLSPGRVGEGKLEFSKIRLGIYDFLGIIIPGLVVICEGIIFVRGWSASIEFLGVINGIGLTLLVLLAFGIGNLTQELGSLALAAVKGKRYAQSARDEFWQTDEAKHVKEVIKKESGFAIEEVDAAFDYALTKIKDRFAKRDVFVAVSDMCRSFVVSCALALIPAVRIAFHSLHPISWLIGVLLVLIAVGWLAWKRMERFRYLSEVTVFRVYLAVASEPIVPSASEPKHHRSTAN